MSVTCARAALGRNVSWKCLKAMGMFVYGFGKQRPAVYEKAQVDGDTTEEPSSSRLGWEFTIYAHAGLGDTDCRCVMARRVAADGGADGLAGLLGHRLDGSV